MAAFSSTLYTNESTGKTPLQSHGLAGNCKVKSASVAVTTSLALNDTLNFFSLPKGARVHHMLLRSTDIDSNGSPTVTFDVGDSGSATRFFNQSTIGQTGGTDSALQSTGWEYQVSSDTLIFGTVHAAAATKVAGTVELVCFYTVDGLAS